MMKTKKGSASIVDGSQMQKPEEFQTEGEAEPKGKILIVDDEESVCIFLAAFFQKRGYETMTGRSGDEVLTLMRKDRPSIILLDIAMPGMDGLQCLKKIREVNKNIGVIMITGLHNEKVAKEAIDLGAYAYVLKPFDMKYLEMVVLTRLAMAY